jgi:hypothetical protein
MIYGLYFLGLLSTIAAILTYLYLPKALRILLDEEKEEK